MFVDIMDGKPAGAQFDGVADARGAAAGTERPRGAIAPLVITLYSLDTAIHCLCELKAHSSRAL